ncbi:MAG: hypothetical protein U5K38_16425 [Woeseiaceae bacterium]|nr:hypothetical protein [Woeseiaceae bacterium]
MQDLGQHVQRDDIVRVSAEQPAQHRIRLGKAIFGERPASLSQLWVAARERDIGSKSPVGFFGAAHVDEQTGNGEPSIGEVSIDRNGFPHRRQCRLHIPCLPLCKSELQIRVRGIRIGFGQGPEYPDGRFEITRQATRDATEQEGHRVAGNVVEQPAGFPVGGLRVRRKKSLDRRQARRDIVGRFLVHGGTGAPG